MAEKFSNALIWVFFVAYLGFEYMSKKHKHRKHKPQKQHKKDQSSNHTEKLTRREPVAVMETIKHSSNSVPNPKPTINNTYTGLSYKVVSKPTKWADNNCRFVGQVGLCQGTDRVHGTKLKFSGGEILHFPFENIEIVETKDKPKVVMAEDFIDFEGPPNYHAIKGLTYKVVKKPPGWKVQCRFVGRIGKCILIDNKGIRLRFNDGDDVSFPIDCIKEVPSMDLNKDVSKVNEDDVNIGDLYRVIKRPEKMGEDADQLIGKIGKVKWSNYRGVCLKFSDNSGYTIDFDSVEKYTPIQLDNPTITPMKLNAGNMVHGRKYRMAKLPVGWNMCFNQLLGKLGTVMWASDPSKGAMMKFTLDDNTKLSKVIPFDCMEDFPRPSQSELLEIIKQNPEKILRIIKELNKITRLKPVMDFVEGGVLPDISNVTIKTETTVTPISETTMPPTIGEASELLHNHVLALIGPVKPTDLQNPS